MNSRGQYFRSSRRGISAKPALVLFVSAILPAILLAADAPRKDAAAEAAAGAHGATISSGLPSRTVASTLGASQRAKIGASYSKLPLAFEQNQGQTDSAVDYVARGGNYRLFLTATEAVLSLDQPRAERPAGLTPGRNAADLGIRKSDLEPPAVLRMQLFGSNPNPRVYAEQELRGKSSYFIGNDPAAWRTDISSFARVKYEEVYPGVDLVYHGRQGRLEYDFVLSPGADPESILLHFAGVDEIEFEAGGGLRLRAAGTSVRQKKPFLYQMQDGERVEIAGRFVRRGEDRIGFEVGPYDHERELVIDPEIVYSTYLGGLMADVGRAIAVDSNRNAYIAGTTTSLQFPAASMSGSSLGAEKGFQPNRLRGDADAYIVKLDPSGSEVIYSAFLGGDDLGQFIDTAEAVQVDAAGNAYMTGLGTAGYPITEGSLSDRAGAPDVDSYVITKLNPAGNALVYSTRVVQNVGGVFSSRLVTGFVFDIAVDALQNSYFTGGRIEPDGFQIWVGKINPAGSALLNGVVFGPLGSSSGIGIALDASGNIYATGSTDQQLPTTMGAFQSFRRGGANDAFVLKLNSAFQPLFLTYLGGDNNDTGRSIAAAPDGRVFVTGFTGGMTSTGTIGDELAKGFASFPTTATGFDRECCGESLSDAFFVVLNNLGTQMLYGTLIGGDNFTNRFDVGYDLAIGSNGFAHIVGAAAASDFPVTMDAFQPQFGGGLGDAFYAIIDPAAAGLKSLVFSSLLGGEDLDEGWGLALDRFNDAYLTGFSASREFPTTPDSLQPVSVDPGNENGFFLDAFVSKIGERCLVTAATPTSIDFGVVPPLVRSAARTVRLVVDREVQEFGATLSDEINFEVDFQSGRRISATEVEFDIYFLPQQQGSFSATVDFFAAAEANRPACRQRVTLRGQTLTVSADPMRVDFTSDEVECGGPAGPRELRVINTSNAPITLNVAWNNRNALQVAPAGPLVLGAAGSATAIAVLDVTYLTPSESPFADIIRFSSGGVLVLEVPVTAPACGALLSLDPLSLAFGTLPINGSLTLPVTVSSASVGNLPVTVTVPEGQPFSVSQSSFNVSSTAPAIIDVTFQPGTVGFFGTTISFSAMGGAVDLAVSGASRFDMIQITGVEVTVQPTPDPVPTVGVEFGGAPAANLRGRLQLTFAPDNANLAPDPLTAFVDTGNNEVDFRVPAGSTEAEFLVSGTPADAPYQPGTVAGTLTFRLIQLVTEADNQPVDFSGAAVAMTRIEPAAPLIQETTCQRSGNTLTITARGLSTTREITAVNFNLQAAPGANLTFTAPAANFANGPIAAWYAAEESIASGSTIAVRVPLTFQGDFAALGQATISFGNGVGTSNVGQIAVSACQ